MSTIAEIKKYPIGTSIPHVTGTVKVVWDRTLKEGQWGSYYSQGFVLVDGEEEIIVNCTDFDDLAYLKGQAVNIASTGKDKRTGAATGVTLTEWKGKLNLKASKKAGGIIGGNTPNPAHMAGGEKAPETPIAAPLSHSKPQTRGIEGVTVGMAVNCAVRLCAANAIPPENQEEYIHEKASALIRLSQRLQAGELL